MHERIQKLIPHYRLLFIIGIILTLVSPLISVYLMIVPPQTTASVPIYGQDTPGSTQYLRQAPLTDKGKVAGKFTISYVPSIDGASYQFFVLKCGVFNLYRQQNPGGTSPPGEYVAGRTYQMNSGWNYGADQNLIFQFKFAVNGSDNYCFFAYLILQQQNTYPPGNLTLSQSLIDPTSPLHLAPPVLSIFSAPFFVVSFVAQESLHSREQESKEALPKTLQPTSEDV